MKPARLALGLGLLLSTACSPVVRFEGRVTVEGVSEPDPGRLHVSVWYLEKGHVESAPFTFNADGATSPEVIMADGDALTFAWMVVASEVEMEMRFWYDVDGDGKVGSADRIGGLPGKITGRDHGLLRGNLTTIDTVHLADVPASDDWGQWPDMQPR